MFLDFLLYNYGFIIIKSVFCYHEEISRSFSAAKIADLLANADIRCVLKLILTLSIDFLT